MNGVELGSPQPVGCMRCGRDRIWQRVILNLPGDEHAETRRRIRYLCGDPEAREYAKGIHGPSTPEIKDRSELRSRE